MSNVQRHHLRLYEAALKKALEGDIKKCLDICFELRLKPDLASYTRASVYITICERAHIHDLPEKADFAKDALKIAKELRVG